jgi:glycerol-3-phosphate dehydrogenase
LRAQNRSEKVDAVNDSIDLLVVGGGINGVGIARDAAGRGLRVALVERGDLACATSSAATKLIHGGLRYLEFFEFRLVQEALIERERLLRIAPHIIRPMRFVWPHLSSLRPRWQIRLGLFLYDHLAGRERLPRSHAIRIDRHPERRGLREGIKHAFVYSDCWADDSRLVVLNAMDAAARGAFIATNTRFVRARQVERWWYADCQDRISGESFEIRARAIVNAAGPWVEKVLQLVAGAPGHATQARLVKGSHIVVPRLFEGDDAFTLQNLDGRVVFAIPYEGRFTLVGTTDVPFEGDPAGVGISAQEIQYLCEASNRYFRRKIAPADVQWSYAGVRPLSDDESVSASRVTRDYTLELITQEGGAVLLSIFGGKITTYRKLAEAALSKLQPLIGGSSHGWTDRVALPGGDFPHADFDTFLANVRGRWQFLPEETSLRLARAYGTRVIEILGAAKSMQDLGVHFGAGLTQAELDYLQAHEWATTAEDVLWRRTKLGLHLSSGECDEVARYMEQQRAPRYASASL